MKRFYIGIFTLLVSAALVSCITSEELDAPIAPATGRAIVFGADLKDAEEVSSRGGDLGNRVGNRSIVSEDEDNTIPMGIYVQKGIRSTSGESSSTRGAVQTSVDAFNVWATYKKDANTTINYFSNVPYEEGANGEYLPVNSADEYYWPGAGSLNFVAVSNTPSNGWVAKYENDALMSFEYTTPADPTEQNDIMVATATASGNANSAVGLTFEHVMSAVNVKIGSVVAGEIRSITFKNVYNKGEYLVEQDVWVVDKSSYDDFSVKMEGGKFVSNGSNPRDTAVNTDDAVFMFIPQNPGDDAEMVIEFYDSHTGHLYSDEPGAYAPALRGSIADDNWEKNKTTNYVLSIDESFTMTIEPVGKKLDAHYVIGYANVTVEGIEQWSVTAITNDGSQVTIQPEEEVNSLAKQGFWTDKLVDSNGNLTDTSARGSSSWKGTGNVTDKLFYIFIPENVNNADREISLVLKGEGSSTASTTKVLLQKYPNWTEGGFGWEVVDDAEEGQYGFKWTRKVTYKFYGLYAVLFSTWGVDWSGYTRDDMLEFINKIVAPYNNGNDITTIGDNGSWLYLTETKVRDYLWGAYTTYTMNVNIDYSRLNNITAASSATDGHANSIALYELGGSATTSSLETALQQSIQPKSTSSAFSITSEEGKLNDLSGILTYIQKKNKYNMQIVTTEVAITYHPVFDINDLKWYLPAYAQFDYFTPDPNVAGDDKANYWSSTAVNGGELSHIGNGDEKDRDLEYRVIAVRKDENNYGTASVNTPSWIE